MTTNTTLTDAQIAALKTAPANEGFIETTARGAGKKRLADALTSKGLATLDANGDLKITDAGLEAIGLKPAPAKRQRKAKAEAPVDGEAKAPRDSKQARMIELMRRPEGMTLADAQEAFGWQPHTVRGAIAGALKKKLGLTVVTERIEGERGMRYRIAG